MEQNSVCPGLELTVQKKVGYDDTSRHYGSGSLGDVFATPSLVALMIEASAKLVDPLLGEGFISIGKASSVVHEQPTLLGETVSVKVVIREADRYRIIIDMEAYDEVGLIGRGTHERIIVDRDAFFRRSRERAGSLENKDY